MRKCMKCTRPATLVGTYNGALGSWYYCTQHMKMARENNCFLQYIWPINGKAQATEAQLRVCHGMG